MMLATRGTEPPASSEHRAAGEQPHRAAGEQHDARATRAYRALPAGLLQPKIAADLIVDRKVCRDRDLGVTLAREHRAALGTAFRWLPEERAQAAPTRQLVHDVVQQPALGVVLRNGELQVREGVSELIERRAPLAGGPLKRFICRQTEDVEVH